MKVPITRAITYKKENKPFSIQHCDNNMWDITYTTDISLQTHLPDIKFLPFVQSHEFFQTIVNILIFNKIDPTRLIVIEGTELLYFMKVNEVITIPILPEFEDIDVTFTLTNNIYDVNQLTPTMRITKNENVDRNKKRKR